MAGLDAYPAAWDPWGARSAALSEPISVGSFQDAGLGTASPGLGGGSSLRSTPGGLGGATRGLRGALAPPEDGPDRQVEGCLSGIVRPSVDLALMSVNLRHFSTYPRDAEAGQRLLHRIAAAAPVPDIVCVQEGLEGVDVLAGIGYDRVVSSAPRARPLRDMVYGRDRDLEFVDAGLLDRLLVNEIYIRKEGSEWEAVDCGVAQLSSELMLPPSFDAGAAGQLAVRSVVWVKLRHRQQGSRGGPAFTYVFNTQLTGGPVEDRFFAGPLRDERRLQLERLVGLFNSRAGRDDQAVLVGDFKVPVEDPLLPGGVAADAVGTGLGREELARRFQAYSQAPLATLKACGWLLASGRAGRLCGHVATSRHLASAARVLVGQQCCPPPPAHTQELALWESSFKVALKVVGGEVGHEVRGPSPQPARPMSAVSETSATSATIPEPVGSRVSATTLSQAQSIRHIKAWLASTAPVGVEARSQQLRSEHQELTRECNAEVQASEAMQASLSSEMRELRDQCHEQGQMVTALTQRLAEARNAVTAELQSAAAVRSALSAELTSEEAQRRAVEASRLNEESEVLGRVEAAEQQLARMSLARGSMEDQLRVSVVEQGSLRAHIAHERGDRSEQEALGEQKLSELSEHGAEAADGRSAASRELLRLEQESERNARDEIALLAQLKEVQALKKRTRCSLQAEAAAWQTEGERLRERMAEADEEQRRSSESLNRCLAAQGACGCERSELEVEAQRLARITGKGGVELDDLERLSEQYEESLLALREAVDQIRIDEKATKLADRRDQLAQEINAAECRMHDLEGEIEASKNQIWGFPCMRKPPPPRSEPAREPVRSGSGGRIGAASTPPPKSLPAPKEAQGSQSSARRQRGAPRGAEEDSPGLYRLVDDRTVRQGAVVDDSRRDIVDELPAGAIVNVLEIRMDGQRVRGRIEAPAGWVTLASRADGSRSALKASDDDLAELGIGPSAASSAERRSDDV